VVRRVVLAHRGLALALRRHRVCKEYVWRWVSPSLLSDVSKTTMQLHAPEDPLSHAAFLNGALSGDKRRDGFRVAWTREAFSQFLTIPESERRGSYLVGLPLHGFITSQFGDRHCLSSMNVNCGYTSSNASLPRS
jgi:hypothetical protein